MSEISTTFSANSSEFAAEVKKAITAVDYMGSKAMPKLQREMQAAQAEALKTAKSMSQIDKSSTNTGANMLQLSYFVDDLQYGFRGIANNIPGLIQGLGGSMGLAGALSIVGLGLATVLPLMYKFYTAGDSENIVAGAKAYSESIRDSVIEMEKFNRQLAIRRDLEAELKSFQESLDTQTGVSPSITQAENELDALRKKNALQAQIEDAAGQARIAEAKKNFGDVSAVEQQVLAEKTAANAKRLADEIALAKKIAELRQADADLIGAGATVSEEEFAKQQQEMDARITDLQNRAATAAANLKRAEEEAKDINPYTTEDAVRDNILAGGNQGVVQQMRQQQEAQNRLLADNLRIAQEQERKTKAQLDDEMERARVLETMSKMSESQRATALKAAQEAAEDARRQVADLEDQQAAQEEIAKAKQAQAKAEAEVKKQEKLGQVLKEAEDEMAKEERKAAEEKKRKTALTDAQAELMVLRAQAAGQNRFAEALQKRITLAKEARSIAEATGLSEKDALALAKEKMKLEDTINKNKNKPKVPQDGRIRLFRAGEAPGTLQRGAAGTMLRSEAFTRRTQAWMGSPQKVKTDNSISEEQLDVQRQLLKIWSKNLGVV